MTASTASASVTVTVPASAAWRLKSACGDSACHWHRLWQDAMDGKRPDLDADACASLSREAWALWESLNDQGI